MSISAGSPQPTTAMNVGIGSCSSDSAVIDAERLRRYSWQFYARAHAEVSFSISQNKSFTPPPMDWLLVPEFGGHLHRRKSAARI